MLQIDEKVAIVTGAARGIGLATAKLLAAAGARVIIADRDGDELADPVRLVGELGDGVCELLPRNQHATDVQPDGRIARALGLCFSIRDLHDAAR